MIVKGTRSAKISETNGASTMCGPSTTKTPPKVKTPSPHARMANGAQALIFQTPRAAQSAVTA